MIKKALCAILVLCMLLSSLGVTGIVSAATGGGGGGTGDGGGTGATGSTGNTTPDVTMVVTLSETLTSYKKGSITYEDLIQVDISIDGLDEDEFVNALGKYKLSFDGEKAKILGRASVPNLNLVTVVPNNTPWDFANEAASDLQNPSYVNIHHGATNYVVNDGSPIPLITVFIQVTDEDIIAGKAPLDITIDDSEFFVQGLEDTTVNYTYTWAFASKELTFDPRSELTGVSASDNTVVYDGNVKNIELSGTEPTDDITYTCNGSTFNGAKDEGTYVVTANVLREGCKPFSVTKTLTIEKAPLTANIVATDRQYNGVNSKEVVLTGSLSGEVYGDDSVALETLPMGEIADGNAGDNKPVTIPTLALTGADAGNYILTQPTGVKVNITTAPLTVTALQNYTYDLTGSEPKPSSLYTVEGLVNDEEAEDVLSGNIDDNGLTPDWNNGVYTLTQGTLVANSNYEIRFTDGKVTVIGGQDVEFNPSEIEAVYGGTTSIPLTINDGNIGEEIEVTSTKPEIVRAEYENVFTGDDYREGNIVLTYLAPSEDDIEIVVTIPENDTYKAWTKTFDVNVAKAQLEIVDFEVSNKEYDGTNVFPISGRFDGLVGSDVIPFPTEATVASKDAGKYELELPALTGDADKYELNFVAPEVEIKKIPVYASVYVENKVYDGETILKVASANLIGDPVLDNEEVKVFVVAHAYSKKVGTYNLIEIEKMGLDLPDSVNYELQYEFVDGVDGYYYEVDEYTITPKELTVDGLKATDRVYDGTAVVALTGGELVGIMGNDDVTAKMPVEGTVADANAGSDKLVTVPAITLEGEDAVNYILTQPANITVNISAPASTPTYRPSYSGGGGGVSTPVTPDKDDASKEDVKDTEEKDETKDDATKEDETKEDEAKEDETKPEAPSTDYAKATATVSLKENASEIRFVSTDEDGKFNPDAEATRNEVVNALNEVLSIVDPTGDCELSDIEGGENAAIVELFTKANIIAGYEDGTFRGEGSITRAEFVKILTVALGLEIKEHEENKVNDIEGHWAQHYVNSFVELGYILGYPDGSFKPDASISKAEVVIIVNRVIGKDVENTDNSDVTITDMDDSHWAYEYVMSSVK